MKTTLSDAMELKLSQIIRKNLTIRCLSVILGEMMAELVNDKDLVIYTGNFESINTLLDCILDETNANDEDLEEFQEYFETLLADTNDRLGAIETGDITSLEKMLDLPGRSLYKAIKELRNKRKSGGGD
jgi:hypothetical protein